MKTCADRPGRSRGRARPAALRAQRRAAVHRHGRDGGRRGARGAGAQGHPHGGGPARHARAAGGAGGRKRALDRETLGYTVALGLPALRARIAGHYRQRYGVAVAPERVVVTTGSSAGFVLAFLALFDAGAKVALPSPGYPCYRHILTGAGPDPGARSTTGRRRALDADRGARSTSALAATACRASSSPAPPTRRAPCWSRARLAEIARSLPAPRHLAGLRRDLPRPDLRPAGGDGAGPRPRRDRRQQLLQVFLDDGLARGLAGGARGAGPAHRAAGPEPLHLAAHRGAGRGHRRLRRHR